MQRGSGHPSSEQWATLFSQWRTLHLLEGTFGAQVAKSAIHALCLHSGALLALRDPSVQLGKLTIGGPFWHATLGSESWRAYQWRWCGRQLSRVAANKLPRRARQSARSASRKPAIVMLHALGSVRNDGDVEACGKPISAWRTLRLSTLSTVPKLRANLSTGSDQRVGNKPSPPALFMRPDSASAPPRASGSYRLAASWNVARNPGCRALRRQAAQR